MEESKDKTASIGARLGFLIEARFGDRGKSAFAAFIGVPEATLHNYLASRSQPRADTLERIVRATGCNPGWLLLGEGSPWPSVAAGGKEAQVHVNESAQRLGELVDSVQAMLRALRPLLDDDTYADLSAKMATGETNGGSP